jgi:hypothetical protein
MTVLSSPLSDTLKRWSEAALPVFVAKDIFFDRPPNFFDYVYAFFSWF